jgi:predicted metal-dependent peptidase
MSYAVAEWNPPTIKELKHLEAAILLGHKRIEEYSSEMRYIFNNSIPFLGHLVNKVAPEVALCGTAMTTNEGSMGRIYFDPIFVSQLTRGQFATVWLHEMLHQAFGYFSRVGTRDQSRFNRAHDYAINLVIQDFMDANPKLGLEWPTIAKPLLDRRFTGMTAEKIYDVLTSEDEKKEQQEKSSKSGKSDEKAGQGAGEKGSNQGSEEGSKPESETKDGEDEGQGKDEGDGESEGGQDGDSDSQEGGKGKGAPKGGDKKGGKGNGKGDAEADESDDAGGSGGQDCNSRTTEKDETPRPRDNGEGYHDATDCVSVNNKKPEGTRNAENKNIEENWKRAMAEAKNIQAMRGIGNMPGGLESILDEIFKPKVNWMQAVIFQVDGHLRGRGRTYTRLAKRSLACEVMLPGRSRKNPRFGIVMDTSASVSDEEEKAFLGLARQLAENVDGDVRLIQVDTIIHEDKDYDDLDRLGYGKKFGLKGRGGTNFSLVPALLHKSEPEPVDLVLIFTDGEPMSWPDINEWPCPVIVVTTRTMPPASYKGIKLEMNQYAA